MNQAVAYRFGETNWVTDFVLPNNPDIKEQAILTSSLDTICDFTRDKFAYPLIHGNPSSDATFYRYRKCLCKYHWKSYVPYIWSFPQECLLQRLGICIDTANLCTSLLIATQENAWVAIGEVRQTDTCELLGYHAWTTIENILIETTIHSAGTNNRVCLADAYSPFSEWAKSANIYYIEDARYNDKEYIGTTDIGKSGLILRLLFTPKKYPYLASKQPLLNKKLIYREWRKDEINKQRFVEAAYEKA